MEQDKKYFTGKLNADDADFSVGADEYVNAENIRYGTTDSGVVKTLESIGSTALVVNNYLPSGTNIVIGRCEDAATGREYHFNWNSNGHHGIYCYDINTNTTNTGKSPFRTLIDLFTFLRNQSHTQIPI